MDKTLQEYKKISIFKRKQFKDLTFNPLLSFEENIKFIATARHFNKKQATNADNLA
jgi:hypothetical protein